MLAVPKGSWGHHGTVLEPWGQPVTPDSWGCIPNQLCSWSSLRTKGPPGSPAPHSPHSNPPRCTSGLVSQLEQAPSASVCLFAERGTPSLVS